ncbi:recombinase family protein [Paraburkholderia sp. Ac-20342]|uniref:recombinase family protein n=1 Tax=Paraburkholderia sp. Ac-20342 TaxID=2703889 RepID=UPI001982167F|nr:recombinase family protein [Paraburkholderia sp. Ac-20342]MBN3851172.1 recombinase family protein [Paraburkholderia sp. Ac-20342]
MMGYNKPNLYAYPSAHMRPKAYSYIRFSTPEQAKGDSFRRQLDLSKAYAEAHNLELDETLSFRDLGVSAFDQSNLGKDGGLRQFIRAIETGKVKAGSYLLVESLDRISRAQVLDAFQVFIGILRHNITVVTMADGWVYSEESTNSNPLNLIVSLTILSRAHEESLMKSKRLKAAWQAKRNQLTKRKLTKICPAWLRLNNDGTEYEIIEEKAAVVRKIVEWIMSGMGRHAIVKRLNEAGTPSIGSRGKSGTWFESYILKIIRNRALIGEFQPHSMVDGKRLPTGEPIADYFPRLISDEEFGLLQQTLAERSVRSGGQRGIGFSNLFTGLIICGYCGGTMVYVNKGESRRRGSPNRFIVCAKAKRGAGCHHVPWNYDDLENTVLNHARGVNFSQFVKETKERDARLGTLNAARAAEKVRLDGIKERRDRLISSIETVAEPPMGIIERITQYDQEILICQDKILKIEGEILPSQNQAALADAAIDGLDSLMSMMASAEGDDLYLLRARLNEHFRQLVQRITLFPGGTFTSQKEIEKIKRELLKGGQYTEDQVNEQLALSSSTEPRRENRTLVISNRSGQPQVVRPENVFPDFMTAMHERPAHVSRWASKQKKGSSDPVDA